MKTCPYCSEQIQDAAVKCRFCGEWLSQPIAEPQSSPSGNDGAAMANALPIIPPKETQSPLASPPPMAEASPVTPGGGWLFEVATNVRLGTRVGSPFYACLCICFLAGVAIGALCGIQSEVAYPVVSGIGSIIIATIPLRRKAKALLQAPVSGLVRWGVVFPYLIMMIPIAISVFFLVPVMAKYDIGNSVNVAMGGFLVAFLCGYSTSIYQFGKRLRKAGFLGRRPLTSPIRTLLVHTVGGFLWWVFATMAIGMGVSRIVIYFVVR